MYGDDPYAFYDPYSVIASAPTIMTAGAFGGGVDYGNAPNPSSAPAPMPATGTSGASMNLLGREQPPPSYTNYSAQPQPQPQVQQQAPIAPPAPYQPQAPAPTNFGQPNISNQRNPSTALSLPGPTSGQNVSGLPPSILPFMQDQASAAGSGQWNIIPGQPAPLQAQLQQIMRSGAGGPQNTGFTGGATAGKPQPPPFMVPPPPATIPSAQYQSIPAMMDATAASMQQPQETQGKKDTRPMQTPQQLLMGVQGQQEPMSGRAPSDAYYDARKAALGLEDLAKEIPQDLQAKIAKNLVEMNNKIRQGREEQHRQKIIAVASHDRNLGVLQAEFDRQMQERQKQPIPPLPMSAAQQAIEGQNRGRMAARENLNRAGRIAMGIQYAFPRNRLPGVAPYVNRYLSDMNAAQHAEQQDLSLEARKIALDTKKLEHEVQKDYEAGREKLVDDWLARIKEIDLTQYRDQQMAQRDFRDQTNADIREASLKGRLNANAAHMMQGMLALDQQNEIQSQKIDDSRLNNLVREFISNDALQNAAYRNQLGYGNLMQRQEEDKYRQPAAEAQTRMNNAMAQQAENQNRQSAGLYAPNADEAIGRLLQANPKLSKDKAAALYKQMMGQ